MIVSVPATPRARLDGASACFPFHASLALATHVLDQAAARYRKRALCLHDCADMDVRGDRMEQATETRTRAADYDAQALHLEQAAAMLVAEA